MFTIQNLIHSWTILYPALLRLNVLPAEDLFSGLTRPALDLMGFIDG
jgi:hypothetical protein